MREFEVNIDSVIDGLSEFEMQSKTAISGYADIAAKKLEEDAKKMHLGRINQVRILKQLKVENSGKVTNVIFIFLEIRITIRL
ncbi:hypothetical protein CLQ_06503 [Clostridium botulinum Af84]|nr:hypothetical protein [Clostridium botulinum]EPS55147.1 hypothetical protein CLQ_06503 [Clostridium botulinum Af84]